jgi:hypothetical protein
MTVFFVATKNLTSCLSLKRTFGLLIWLETICWSRTNILPEAGFECTNSIAWSVIVRAGTPWQCKIVISRRVYFTRSYSRSVNFLARPYVSYSVREVEVTVLSPIVCGNWNSEGHVLAIRACTVQIERSGMTVSFCAGLHGTARHGTLKWLYV